MKATEMLMHEHEFILRVIAAMEKAVVNISNPDITPQFFLQAADFIKNFADACHHAKEEGVLFKMMSAAGVAVEGGPIGVMLAEHEQGRQLTRAMRSAAEQWAQGDLNARTETTFSAMSYANLLRQHINKENRVLFPMADQMIPHIKQIAMWQEFERIEREETGEGIHEKYEALAEKLEAEAAEF